MRTGHLISKNRVNNVEKFSRIIFHSNAFFSFVSTTCNCMFKAKFILNLILLLFLMSNFVFAQENEDFRMEERMENEKVENKEVESKIKIWYLDGYGAFKDSTTIDTLLDNFHIYHPIYKNALTNTYVGNYGTPYLNNDFFKRETYVDFFFLKTRDAYLLTPATIKYYNTTTPYTRLDFSQSENKARKSEIRFNVLHSQNVNPYLNFTFRYDQAKSIGQYNYQESKNNIVTLYSNYNKDNVSIHAGFVSNAIKNMENGGLKNESDILGPDDTEYLPTNLSNSRNHFSSTYYYLDSEYKIGKYEAIDDSTDYFRPVGGIIYSIQYERHKQEFMEEELDTTFFDNTYYDDDYFKDSIRYNVLTNIVQLKQYENANRKLSFGKRAFIGIENVKGSTPWISGDVNNRKEIKHSGVFAGGGIFRQTGKFWIWNFDGKIYFLGRKAGQTEINGNISKPVKFWGDSLAALVIDGSIENRVADVFQESFYSNHVRWENNFKTEKRITTGGKFVSDKRKLEIGARYAIINNFIYNDTLGIPAQTGTELVVLSAFLDKDFNYRNLHFRPRLLWQKASNEKVLHLPDWSVFISAYYQLVISKVMYTQIGVDTRYNTSYYADAYAPNTGLFYLQTNKKYGDYPYIDVYATLRLKRTTAFFKMLNVGSEFLKREYITTPTYPMVKSTFRFGITWAFYD